MPRRIRLSRKRGWRKPANTVDVARPSKWGNPFAMEAAIAAGWAKDKEGARRVVVERFADWLGGSDRFWVGPEAAAARTALLASLPVLRGKNLACWCPMDGPCHADVLLAVANR